MVSERQFPDSLMLHVYSVADFDRLDRASSVIGVFDEFPDLRPLKVGAGDPPRMKVTTMSDVMRGVKLPIRYLTVRNTKPQYEGGELNLYHGRGGYTSESIVGSKEPPKFWILPHEVRSNYGALSHTEQPDPVQLTQFFRRLCEEMDAFYGFVTTLNMWRHHMTSLPHHRGNPFAQLAHELPDVLWLNYFGPSWLMRVPELRGGLRYSTIETANGGVILQTTDTPFVLEEESDPVWGYPWKRPLIDALGSDTFKWKEQTQAPPGVLVPSWEQHFAASHGTDELPWANWDQDIADRKRKARERTFPKKVSAMEQLCTARGGLPRSMGHREFSTSLDASEFRAFFRKLAKSLRGDFETAIGKALLAEIAAAPIDTERSYHLVGQPGGVYELVEFRYFIDDIDTVDFYLFGSDSVAAACEMLLKFEE